MRVTPRLTRAACGHEYRSELVVSNAVRWDKAKNPIFWIGENLGVRRHVPDYCLTNGICSLDYCLWWYWIPLAFDWHPILTLPHIVASAVTISVRATRHSIGDRRCSSAALHRASGCPLCAKSVHANGGDVSRW